MAVMNSIRVLMATTSCVGADLFDTEFYPGSSGVVSFVPVATKHTLVVLVTAAVLLYGSINLFRRFYLERYDRDGDGRLYPVECKPVTSFLDALFSLLQRWGILKSRQAQLKQQCMFAGWAQAFTQRRHYWKRIGEGRVTIVYYPQQEKYQLVLKTSAGVVLINHELTKNMALFREGSREKYASRWSAIDFASFQPKAETFCLCWNNLLAAESFNTAFYKCTQPGSYTDEDFFPLTVDLNLVPSGVREMDFTGQIPIGVNKYIQTSDSDGDCFAENPQEYQGNNSCHSWCKCNPNWTYAKPPASNGYHESQRYDSPRRKVSRKEMRQTPTEQRYRSQTSLRSAPSQQAKPLEAASKIHITRSLTQPAQMSARRSGSRIGPQPFRARAQKPMISQQKCRLEPRGSQLSAKSSRWDEAKGVLYPAKSVHKPALHSSRSAVQRRRSLVR